MKLENLSRIAAGHSQPISDLTRGQLTELQLALNSLGLPAGDIDGEFGPKTRHAWAEFKADHQMAEPALIDADAIKTLQQLLDQVRTSDAWDLTTRAGTIAAIRGACQAQGIGLRTQIAYVLATVEHETNNTFKPVREAYYIKNAETWRKAHLRYYPYYGRGYVQLTHETNYRKYGTLLTKGLVKQPDLALDPQTSLFVLVHGFKTGSFTGRDLARYINAHETDFINARRCINGLDQADHIAGLAKKYL
ncbi:peptidoglycan-binding protein [uncultured Thiodictyon sp.]|jgi:predicted chitinase|uniref:peptidoglycan-binding protein n=1 Tax=uncultured Thiodictyon sp. TaxID=1846217 RepID=UPI0025FB8DE5|nr:peptidoglycan-binding protein [uncultured Thiodictyon sp.]